MSGPFTVKAVQFGGIMPGGHGSASFTVPVANAYLAPHHSLREGEWITIFDVGGHELYEGEIFTVKPQVDASGNHSFAVTCGGLISVAGKRADVSATWVHRGSEGWIRRPGTPSNLGNVSTDNGTIDLRVSLGSTQSYAAVGLISALEAVFVLDDGLSDDTISHVDVAGLYDVAAESTFNWTWTLFTAPTLGGTYTASALTSTGGTSAGFGDHLSPPAGTKVLLLQLKCASGAHTTAAEKYLTLTTSDIFAGGRTTKPRIDEAMVALATRPGLALTSYSQPVGPALDDLRVGGGKGMVTAAAGLATLATLHAEPFSWAFWDDRHFVCEPTPIVSDDKTIVVGGGSPPEGWDVAEEDETVPQVACVLFGNLPAQGDATLPEGWPRKLYRPETPADDADLRVTVADFSGLILSDASAAALGSNVIGGASGSTIPAGEVFDAAPATAKEGTWPGNNVDPTSDYQDGYSALLHGHLTNMAYSEGSGWAGSGSALDPYLLVGDGVDDYVDWGDVAACDFGTTAFSVRKWLKVNALPAAGTVAVGAGKLDGTRGWSFGVTASGKLRGYVGGAAAVVPPVVVTTTGTVTTTTDGAYTVHKFTAGSGSVTVSAGDSVSAEYMVVGGGGGGDMGGGGAGGYLAGTTLLSGSNAVAVGAGGAYGPTGAGNTGYPGGNSALGALIAYGGGGGAAEGNGAAGGSGGGAAYTNGGSVHTGGAATPAGQGYAGGDTLTASYAGKNGAGGGGAAAKGQNEVSGIEAGDGGAGVNNDIVLTGTNVGYAGGGGGGAFGAYTPGHATHGGGGGGTAGGTNGTANTGGGGGGTTSGTPGNGGSGIVVVRYLTPDATAAANCRQMTGSTTLAVGGLYHVTMTYGGSGQDIGVHVAGIAETCTGAGAVGAHDLSTAGSLKFFKGDAAVYAAFGLGRVTAWSHVLTADEMLTDLAAGGAYAARSMAKGTVVITGTVRNRRGAPVPAIHVRAGWAIQNLDWQPDPALPAPTLAITAHSVDLAGGKNALTIGKDWMEDEIGVRMGELLAMPATAEMYTSLPEPVVSEAYEPDPGAGDEGADPGPDDSETTPPMEKKTIADELTGGVKRKWRN